MSDRTTYTAFLTQILLFVFLSLFTWSHISGECVCHSFTCRCRNVDFIPQLDSSITSVIIEDSVCVLQRKFMANLSTLALEELYLHRTMIRNSERNFFVNFPYLKKLTFRYPITNIRVLDRAFHSLHLTKISKLEIVGVSISSSISSLLMTLNGTNITELSLVDCQLTTFNCTNFVSSLKHLQYLDLSWNFIHQASWSHTNHLQVLKFKHSSINPPVFLESNRTPFFPNLRHLEISMRQIEIISSSTFEGLDNLVYLWFSVPSGRTMFSTRVVFSIPKLQSLHIEGLFKIFVDHGVFKGCEQLQYLELKNIYVYSGSGLFRHTPNLLSLKLESTQISLLTSTLNEELMPLKKLESFTMSNSELQEVPHVLCSMSNLIRIDLTGNRITFWNNTNCPVMSRLQFLSLSKNEIQIIEKNTFSCQLMSNDELVWDLSGNYFLCNCRLVWFMNWSLQRQKQLRSYLTCKGPPRLKGTRLNSSLFSDGQCSTKDSLLIIVLVPLGSFILIAIAIGTLLYYKRWSIRYFLYLMQSYCKQQKYSFDAFVCYHNGDTEWLLKELCPKLEEENNFSLAIHDRDFKTGWDVLENIVESIKKSRKILLLLSNKFACCNWCFFEILMAIERKENSLVVVLLEDIDISKQSRRLTLLLKQETYLEWTDNKEGQALFWHRLISCLKAPKSRHSMG